MPSTNKETLYRRRLTVRNVGIDLQHGVKYHDADQVVNFNWTNSAVYGGGVADWKAQIRHCSSATTSLDGTRLNAKFYEGTSESWVPKVGTPTDYQLVQGDLLQPLVQFSVASDVLSTIADNKARSKILQHYMEKVNTWRGGNFLAEIRESIHMLRHPVESFYRETWSFAGKVNKLGKVYKKNPVNYGKALANAWLAYAFGVKPFVQDANDAMTVLNNLGASGRIDTTRLSGFGRDMTMTYSPNNQNSGLTMTGPGFIYDIDTRFSKTVRYYGAIKCDLPGNRAELKNAGLDVFDIVPAVWEAIPWSFFIDYFANVQEVLDGYRLWSVESGWFNRTIRNSTARNYFNLRFNPNVTFRGITSGGKVYLLSTKLHRRADQLPHPNWHFQMPGFPSLKWLNIAALTRQVLGSHPTIGRV